LSKYIKTKLLKHQQENLEFGMQYDGFILGDDMGIGKTLSALTIAITKKYKYNYKRCLVIVCIDELKYNWCEEIEKHCSEKARILGGRVNSKNKFVVDGMDKRLYDLNNLKDEYFLITNIETIKDEKINKKLVKMIKDNEINMIVVDEIHILASHTSQRAKGLFKLKSQSQIAMSGTLFLNRPLDAYISLNWLDCIDKNVFKTFTDFKYHFCVMGGFGNTTIVGYKNLEELKEYLKTVMIRHKKSDVLDLPPKIYKTEYIELSKNERKLYNDISKDFDKKLQEITIQEEKEKWALVKTIRLKQVVGFPALIDKTVKETSKLDRLITIIKELKDNNRKCIVFSNWTKITNAIKARLKLEKIEFAYVTGEVKNKNEEINKFKDSKTCTVILGTTSVLGTGYNLTEADTVIFYEQPTSPGHRIQAEDRAYRIGTNSSIQIISLIAINTKDIDVINSNLKKDKFSTYLLGD